jgi:sec-independent protein translocase protein TatA
MFENLSLPHLLMVLAVAILVFGPKRIPEIAGSMGKGIREFKRHISEVGRPDSTDDSAPSRTAANERVSSTSIDPSRTEAPASGEGRAPKRLLQ